MLSDQEALTPGGKQKGRWPYEGFCNALITILQAMPSEDYDELIGWWNEYAEALSHRSSTDRVLPRRTVFGDVSFSEDQENNEQAQTVASLMRQQRYLCRLT